MSNLFSRIFNSGKHDTTYSGPKPYGSLLDAAGGNDYYNTIKTRMGGKNVGYEPDYVNKASNPVIARMQNNFKSNQLPELQSELTATGRRAGSSGFGQIQKAYENEGLNEEAAYAPIYQAAQEARRGDINTATEQVGAFNKGDYDARTILSNFENADNNRQVAEANQRRANEAEGLQKTGQAGVQLLLGAPSLPTGGGVPTGSYVNSGSGKYPTSSPPVAQQDYYKQLLARGVASQGQKGRAY